LTSSTTTLLCEPNVHGSLSNLPTQLHTTRLSKKIESHFSTALDNAPV